MSDEDLEDKKVVTMAVLEEDKEKVDQFKVHEREPYRDVFKRVIDDYVQLKNEGGD